MPMVTRNLLRRAVITLGSAAVIGGVAVAAHAQQYPSQDIHFISAFPAGSGSDIMVRFVADKMRPLAGRTIVVENKPGAAGNIGAEYVARSKPDGYTILVHNGTSIAANQSLFKNPPINPTKELQVAGAFTEQPFMIAVDAKSPFKTLQDLTAAVKPKGDKASYGQATTFAKVMGELYKKASGVTATDVPYKSSAETLNDLFSGQLDYVILDPVFSVAQHKAGKVRILAVSTAKRIRALPDVSTLREAGADVELSLWFGLMVPSETPRPIVNQLNGWLREVVAMDEMQKFLINIAGDPVNVTPDEGQKRFLKDQADWADHVKAAGIERQ